MRDETDIVRDRQLAIRRELDRRGISLKAVSLDAGMSYSTVQSYFPADPNAAPAIMSVAALYRLLASKAVPAELLSLLLPDGFVIVQVPAAVDYDDVSSLCQEYLERKERAHHPTSPAGREISDCEGRDLSAKVVRLGAVA